jgi:hypothetical protein
VKPAAVRQSKPVERRRRRDIVEILRSKAVGERLTAISLEVGALSPADTAKFFHEKPSSGAT